MIVELHILQNFAPSNLNRDDTNSPKDCEFGGFRRARISSQCLKRAIRTEFSRSHLIDDACLSKRTKRLVDELVRRLENSSRLEPAVRPVVEFALNSAGLATKEGKTQYLLFLASASITRFAELIDQHWDTLQAIAPSTEKDAKATKAGKKKAKAEAPESLKTASQTLLNGKRAADLALFGRMLADLPEQNISAASQVAHAISTNKVEMEFDFYTAVDDLQTETETGAGMMGTVEFNSSCFYRYANVDVTQLTENLGGDSELVRKTVEAFLRAAVLAIPSGKQNSMAAHNPPSLVMTVVRPAGHWSLANAFVKPVWPRRDGDLVSSSIERLAAHWEQLVAAYGDHDVKKCVLALGEPPMGVLATDRVQSKSSESHESALDTLVRTVLASLQSSSGKDA